MQEAEAFGRGMIWFPQDQKGLNIYKTELSTQVGWVRGGLRQAGSEDGGLEGHEGQGSTRWGRVLEAVKTTLLLTGYCCNCYAEQE